MSLLSLTSLLFLAVMVSSPVAADRVGYIVKDIGKTGCALAADCTLHKDGTDRQPFYAVPVDSWKSSKHCYCKYKFNEEYDDCRVFNISSSSAKFAGTYVLSSQSSTDNYWFKMKTGYNEPNIVFWKNNDDSCWYASTVQDGSWSTTDAVKCCGHDSFAGCNGDQLTVTDCKMLTRSDKKCTAWVTEPTNSADGFPNNNALCVHNEACSMGGWCGTETWDSAYCDLCSSPSMFFGPCSFDELMAPVDMCDISPLDHVTASLTASDYLDIAGSLAGNIPYVGAVFDSMFTVFGALTGAQSTANLANDVIDGVNQQVESLQKCIAQEISELSGEIMQRDYTALMQEMQLCSGYSGSDKELCINSVFRELFGRVMADFTKIDSDVPFLDYENRLSAFQAAKSLWMTIVSGQLEVQQSTKDGCNFNNDLHSSLGATQSLIDWAKYAEDAIVYELTSPLLDSTVGSEDPCSMYKKDQGWEYFHTALSSEWAYAITPHDRMDNSKCKKQRFQQQIKVYIQMTKFTDKWCTIYRRGDWVCDYQTVCYQIYRSRDHVAKPVQKRLNNDFRPQFKKKFVDDLNTFIASLKTVPEMTCDQPASEQKLEREQREQQWIEDAKAGSEVKQEV